MNSGLAGCEPEREENKNLVYLVISIEKKKKKKEKKNHFLPQLQLDCLGNVN